MKALKILVLVLSGIVGMALAVGFMLPDQARGQREISIQAPPATVFTILDGFRQFSRWSPWHDIDPTAQYVFEGPLTGVGAKMSWYSDNRNLGVGSQEIVESEPYQRIRTQLDLGDFGGAHCGVFELTPEAGGTQLVWALEIDADGNLLQRYFGLMIDSLIGDQYESGLQSLKALAESLPAQDFADLQPQLVEVQGSPLAVAYGEADAASAGDVLQHRYDAIRDFMQAQGLRAAGAPIAMTLDYNEQTADWRFNAAIPLDQPCVGDEAAGVHCSVAYQGTAIRVLHRGPHSAMQPVYAKLLAFKAAAGLQDNGPSWEQYLSDPRIQPESQLQTAVYWPVR